MLTDAEQSLYRLFHGIYGEPKKLKEPPAGCVAGGPIYEFPNGARYACYRHYPSPTNDIRAWMFGIAEPYMRVPDRPENRQHTAPGDPCPPTAPQP